MGILEGNTSRESRETLPGRGTGGDASYFAKPGCGGGVFSFLAGWFEDATVQCWLFFRLDSFRSFAPSGKPTATTAFTLARQLRRV